jgi:hypothetical protein
MPEAETALILRDEIRDDMGTRSLDRRIGIIARILSFMQALCRIRSVDVDI